MDGERYSGGRPAIRRGGSMGIAEAMGIQRMRDGPRDRLGDDLARVVVEQRGGISGNPSENVTLDAAR